MTILMWFSDGNSGLLHRNSEARSGGRGTQEQEKLLASPGSASPEQSESRATEILID